MLLLIHACFSKPLWCRRSKQTFLLGGTCQAPCHSRQHLQVCSRGATCCAHQPACRRRSPRQRCGRRRCSRRPARQRQQLERKAGPMQGIMSCRLTMKATCRQRSPSECLSCLQRRPAECRLAVRGAGRAVQGAALWCGEALPSTSSLGVHAAPCREEAVRNLNGALEKMKQRGGEDPLGESLVHAEQAQQEAPVAAAAPRAGRTRQWEDSPAVAVSWAHFAVVLQLVCLLVDCAVLSFGRQPCALARPVSAGRPRPPCCTRRCRPRCARCCLT